MEKTYSNTEILTAQQILDALLVYTGETINSLARIIGLKRSQNLYDIEDGSIRNFSYELSDKIVKAYPQINKEWLQTGSGKMILDPLTAQQVIPYFKQRQQKALEDRENWFPVYQGNTKLRENSNEVYSDDPQMQIPIAFLPQNMYPGCDYGERATGNSMYPRVVNQGFALGKILDKHYIKFGELYGLHFKQPEGGPPTIKYVKQCPGDSTCVILRADNPHVDDQTISLEEITFIFRVLYIVNPA